eukprot:Polyplicarium_translucidae@DN2066_c0_g1_i3.p1
MSYSPRITRSGRRVDSPAAALLTPGRSRKAVPPPETNENTSLQNDGGKGTYHLNSRRAVLTQREPLLSHDDANDDVPSGQWSKMSPGPTPARSRRIFVSRPDNISNDGSSPKVYKRAPWYKGRLLLLTAVVFSLVAVGIARQLPLRSRKSTKEDTHAVDVKVLAEEASERILRSWEARIAEEQRSRFERLKIDLENAAVSQSEFERLKTDIEMHVVAQLDVARLRSELEEQVMSRLKSLANADVGGRQSEALTSAIATVEAAAAEMRRRDGATEEAIDRVVMRLDAVENAADELAAQGMRMDRLEDAVEKWRADMRSVQARAEAAERKASEIRHTGVSPPAEGRLNWASASLGSSIVRPLTSYGHGTDSWTEWALSKVANLPTIGRYRGLARPSSRSADVVLKSGDGPLQPGDCFAFSPTGGRITMQLPRAVEVSAVGIEHAHPDVNPNVAAAPRAFRVIGGGQHGSEPHVLGEFEYQYPAVPTRQMFDVVDAAPTRRLTFEFESNYGGEWTCVYRIRVHGSAT